MKTVLFLCTGNYYRSRFAEAVFNHHAQRVGLAWRAESRGLAAEMARALPGVISVETVAALKHFSIESAAEPRAPMQCAEGDLGGASLVIALKEAEHRPLLAARFAGWEGHVEYWHVHDLDGATAEAALGEIEGLVRDLVDRLNLRPAGAEGRSD